MVTLKSLNSKLVTLNRQIIDKIKTINPEVELHENTKNNNNKQLKAYYDVLLRHRDEIEGQLNEYENIESKYDNSSIYVKQQHWTYNIYVILSFILIFFTIKKISEGESTISFFILVAIIWAFYIFLIKFYKK